MIISKIKIIQTLSVVLGFSATLLGAAEGDSVLSPAKRNEALEKAKKLLAARDFKPVSLDPFHSQKFQELVYGVTQTPVVGVPVVASRRTEKDVLQAIATSLKPTGNFILSGQPTLVFGQKRVKAGSTLTITFEGTEYTLEITAIERTSFTLRLNREEFTRPIK